MLCVVTRNVALASRWASASISQRRPSRTPSIPESKSSTITIRASSASARAIATRLHMPAESSSGIDAARSRSPTISRCVIVVSFTRASDHSRLRWRRAKATFS